MLSKTELEALVEFLEEHKDALVIALAQRYYDGEFATDAMLSELRIMREEAHS